ncbi:hypothetical protein SNEBB_005691 [Seison nebaliae]|nr:hypothetical protein SNEBB_005691 [Seison nebaliae]
MEIFITLSYCLIKIERDGRNESLCKKGCEEIVLCQNGTIITKDYISIHLLQQLNSFDKLNIHHLEERRID